MTIRKHFIHLLLTPILFLGLLACSGNKDSSKVIQAWEVQAPYFNTYNNQTDEGKKSLPLNRLNLDTEKIKLSITDELVFEDADKNAGAFLSGSTTCNSEKNNDYKYNFKIELAKNNSIYKMLPQKILTSPTRQLVDFNCSMNLIAISSNGSTHDFGHPIQFTLNLENKNFLFQIRDESQSLEKSAEKETQLITLQRARYFFLPKKSADQIYRLSCTNFEKTSQSAETLLALIDSDKVQAEQLCRLFVENQYSRQKISRLFSLRFFDTRDFIDRNLEPIRVEGGTQAFKVVLGSYRIYNPTKNPIFFYSDDLTFQIGINLGLKYPGETKAIGQLSLSLKENERRGSNYTEFIVNPGQTVVAKYVVILPNYGDSPVLTFMSGLQKPTLKMLSKNSWADSSDESLVNLPFISDDTVSVRLPKPVIAY